MLCQSDPSSRASERAKKSAVAQRRNLPTGDPIVCQNRRQYQIEYVQFGRSIAAGRRYDRLIAKAGYSPRFSPDGKRIAFSAMGTDEITHIFIVPSNGGLPD